MADSYLRGIGKRFGSGIFHLKSFFSWLTARGQLSTLDSLRRHSMILPNACPMSHVPEGGGVH